MLRMYSVYDNERERYSNPIFTSSDFPDFSKRDVEAIRIFKSQLFDRHNLIAMFPDKFDLCYLGNFDEVDGVFETNDELPKVIINGNDAIKEMQNESNEN